MIIPVRCFTCGKVIGNKYEEYLKMISSQNVSEREAMDRLGLMRYCCRRMIMTHVEVIDDLLLYSSSS